MQNQNAQKKSGNEKEEYFALLIQLNYEDTKCEKTKAFFAALYFELTVNFGFNFVDRVFFRNDNKSTVAALVIAAIRVVMLQQRMSKEEINGIIKHIFIVPLYEFEDLKYKIFE